MVIASRGGNHQRSSAEGHTRAKQRRVSIASEGEQLRRERPLKRLSVAVDVGSAAIIALVHGPRHERRDVFAVDAFFLKAKPDGVFLAVPVSQQCAGLGCIKLKQASATGSDGKEYCSRDCFPDRVVLNLPVSLQCAGLGCSKLKQYSCVDFDGNLYCSRYCNPAFAQLQACRVKHDIYLRRFGKEGLANDILYRSPKDRISIEQAISSINAAIKCNTSITVGMDVMDVMMELCCLGHAVTHCHCPQASNGLLANLLAEAIAAADDEDDIGAREIHALLTFTNGITRQGVRAL